jgi:hypothetical protein
MSKNKSEVKRLWRQNNPDKVKAQNERRKARRAIMSDAEKDEFLAKRAEYNRRYREKRMENPNQREKSRLAARKYYRKKRGIELDAAFLLPKSKYASEEEKRAAINLFKRKSYAKKLGLTIEELDARVAARAHEKTEKALLRRNETPEQAQQRRAEAAAKKARAAKAKAAGLTQLPPAKAQKPVNANDPPELVALFRKASKGQPPMPYNPKVKKISVFQFRGMR